MKRLLILSALAALALPVAAGETAKAGNDKKKGRTAAKAEPAPPDSPMVAAAKRTKRNTLKAIVITDETVKSSTGRLTTTDSIYDPYLPPKIEPSAEVVANEERAKARAEEQKQAAAAKEAEERRQRELVRTTRLAEQAEEVYDDDTDPARLERDLAAESQKKPQ